MALFKGRHSDWLSAIHGIFLYLNVRKGKESILKGKSTIVY